jgi:hypothetical protein
MYSTLRCDYIQEVLNLIKLTVKMYFTLIGMASMMYFTLFKMTSKRYFAFSTTAPKKCLMATKKSNLLSIITDTIPSLRHI